MLTDENLRFMELVECLRQQGVITDYVHLAQQLDTNKAGISDIKAGRKKISIDILRRMKLSYPQVSIEWVIMGVGDMLNTENHTLISNETVTRLTVENNLLSTQLTEARQTITEQARELGRLEAQIDQVKAKNALSPSYMSIAAEPAT